MNRPSLFSLLLTAFVTTASAGDFVIDGYLHDQQGQLLLGPDHWALEAIGLDERRIRSLSQDKKRSSIIVAVIDTGLDYEHPDIADANLWRNTAEKRNGLDDDGNGYVDDFIGWDFVENDNDPWDDVGHGTHVAGIIAATVGNGEGISGIDAKARIMPLRALNIAGRGYSTGIARAIYYAVDNGAAIINLSMSVRDVSVHEKKAIAYARKSGVLIVAASGNEGSNTADYTPAQIEGVITVAATNRRNLRAGFSNWGSAVDISAPGVEILSLRAQDTDFNLHLGDETAIPTQGVRGPSENYYAASGTSFAAPFVSGAASLLLSQRPALSADDLRRLLLNSATDIDSPGKDQNTGYGLLNLTQAMAQDPHFFIDCNISAVEVANTQSGPVLRVNGTANADNFARASIALGKGNPAATFGDTLLGIPKRVEGGVLGDIPVENLAGATQWTLRMLVQHGSGKHRECRYQVSLG